jgi:hypothetical protein
MISAPRSGFKVLIGFDVLVVVRPVENPCARPWKLDGQFPDLEKDGNISLKLVGGNRGDSTGNACSDLAGAKLHAVVRNGMGVKYTSADSVQAEHRRKAYPRAVLEAGAVRPAIKVAGSHTAALRSRLSIRSMQIAWTTWPSSSTRSESQASSSAPIL